MELWERKQQEALAALPPRLSFAARAETEPTWENFVHIPHEEFPPEYDSGDIRTQPPWVRSTFDYFWKPSKQAPIRLAKNLANFGEEITQEVCESKQSLDKFVLAL